MMNKILLVDDEIEITEINKRYLEQGGYDIDIANDGKEALEKYKRNKYSLIITDIMMPNMDGYDLISEVQYLDAEQPFLFITAKTTEPDKIYALSMGADDYIVKPFSPSEVMARLRAVLRRMVTPEASANVTSENYIKIDNLEINLDEYSLSIGGKKLSLTKKEIETMWTLAENPNKVFTRDNLLESLWGFDYFGDSRTVDSHIKRLRAKLDEVEHPNWCIKTIWGVGYKFDIESKG